MLKYFCLVLFLAVVYAAPADNKKNAAQQSAVEDLDEVVVDNVPVQPSVKKVTTKHPVVEILESAMEHETDGSYSFHYRGEDGSFREETAVVKNPGTKEQYLEITGAYSFIDPDDKEVVVNYKADNRGFVPVGDTIPESISKAAQENSQLPALKKDDDSSAEELEVLKLKPSN